MDIKKIKALVELVKNSGIGEIEIHEGETTIKISAKDVSSQSTSATHSQAQAIMHHLLNNANTNIHSGHLQIPYMSQDGPTTHAGLLQGNHIPLPPHVNSGAAHGENSSNIHTHVNHENHNNNGGKASLSTTDVAASPIDKNKCITSPMVGTFYQSPSPTSEPFVKIGQQVKSGQTLCVIEAMKLMNQIEADKDGTIKEILIKDGSPVEYGETLFILE